MTNFGPALHIDFETRSPVDIKKCGADVYAEHAATDIWCLAWQYGDSPVWIWTPGMPIPQILADHVHQMGAVVAHNVGGFEWVIWNKILAPRYGFPPLKIEQCHCTMAMAYAMSLPGSLEQAASAVGIEHGKDMAGHALMMRMAKPRKISGNADLRDPGLRRIGPRDWEHEVYEDSAGRRSTILWWGDQDRRTRLHAYCKQDVVVEKALGERLLPLSAAERKVWLLDHKINQRGIRVDVKAAKAALEVVDYEKKNLDRRMAAVTKGWVKTCSSVQDLTNWLRNRGADTDTVAKADVTALLERTDLADDVRDALTLRQEAAKSSTAKIVTMLNGLCRDGRIRGLFQYHGAGTGRWAGRRLQPQNLPRPKLKQHEIEDVFGILLSDAPAADKTARIDMLYGAPLDVLASCIRGFLIAEDLCDFIAMDFSNIEGRVLAWLAGEAWKVQAFRDYDEGHGRDIYLLGAERILTLIGRPPVAPLTKHSPERQGYGKVPELALGYQGGVGAFQQMAKNYGVQVTDDEADQIKVAWRNAHPAIVAYWREIEDAAVTAVRQPGTIVGAGPEYARVKFKVAGSFLWLMLPSGRALCYPYPRLERQAHAKKEYQVSTVVDGKPGITTKSTIQEIPLDEQEAYRARGWTVWEKDALVYKGVDPITRQWTDVHTYGGKTVENITQAVARDALAEAMLRLEDAEYPICLHVHDEAGVEVLIGDGSTEEVNRIMAQGGAWTKGLPVACEGWRGKRYRK